MERYIYTCAVPEGVSRAARVDPEQRIELAIPEVSRLFRRVYADYFAQLNLTSTQALIIGLVDIADGEPLNQTDLADRVGLRKAVIGNAVDVLVAGGYLARASDPADARAKIITLTESGVELARTVDEHFGELAAAVRRGTTRAQRRAVIETLTTISENLERFAKTLP
jgi:DNA-binding MarR family transcriptional regulator